VRAEVRLLVCGVLLMALRERCVPYLVVENKSIHTRSLKGVSPQTRHLRHREPDVSPSRFKKRRFVHKGGSIQTEQWGGGCEHAALDRVRLEWSLLMESNTKCCMKKQDVQGKNEEKRGGRDKARIFEEYRRNWSTRAHDKETVGCAGKRGGGNVNFRKEVRCLVLRRSRTLIGLRRRIYS